MKLLQISLVAGFTVLLLGPLEVAAAQVRTACESLSQRVVAGAGLLATGTGVPLDPSLSDAVLGDNVDVGGGLGFSGHLAVPLTSEWSARADVSVARLGVTVTEFGGPPHFEEVDKSDDGHVSMRRARIFVMKFFGRRQRFCGYAGLLAGVYNFARLEVSQSVLGGSALMGVDFPMRSRNGIFVEVQFDVAANQTRPPLDAVRVRILSFYGGLRYRF